MRANNHVTHFLVPQIRHAMMIEAQASCAVVQDPHNPFFLWQGNPGSTQRQLVIASSAGSQLAAGLLRLVTGWQYPPNTNSNDEMEEICGKALCLLHCLPIATLDACQVF